MSPENHQNPKKRKLTFSLQAARQFRQITGEEPPYEVDPSIDVKIPPITGRYDAWEQNKFATMIGHVPTRFKIIQPRLVSNEIPEGFEQSVDLGIGNFNVWVIKGEVKELTLPVPSADPNEYIDVDFGGKALTWVEEATRGIKMVFGEGEDQFTINAEVWCASERKQAQNSN